MFKIGTANRISSAGLKLFDPKHFSIGESLDDADAVVVRSYNLHDTKFSQNLLAIARAGAGVNNIPIEFCNSAGVVLFNTPGANANAVKELVLAGMLLTSRRIIEGMEYVKTLAANQDINKTVEANKKRFAGPELMGKTIGIVGMGAIGKLVAQCALELGMKVIGFDPKISVEAAWLIPSKVQKAQDLKSLLAASDYITLHLPSTPETINLLNEKTLPHTKKGSRILNFARGDLVDPLAIIKAIENDGISAYVTDFVDAKYTGIDGIYCIPHLGASTPEAEENCARMAVLQLQEFLLNGNIKNSVNMPTASLARTSPHRLTFINKNIPKVISYVTTILGEHQLNIVTMMNQSKADRAYTILDLDKPLPPEVLTRLSTIEEIIRLRCL